MSLCDHPEGLVRILCGFATFPKSDPMNDPEVHWIVTRYGRSHPERSFAYMFYANMCSGSIDYLTPVHEGCAEQPLAGPHEISVPLDIEIVRLLTYQEIT